MAQQPARVLASFARATREALESVAAPPIATSLLYRAIAASPYNVVPEDVASFRAFVEGSLRSELQRQLGAAAVSLVIGRLTQVIVAASSDASAGPFVREWSRSSRPPMMSGATDGAHQSGSHPVIRRREPLPEPAAAPNEKRPTMPAPAAPGHDASRAVGVPRSPLPMRPMDGVASPRRPRPPAATVRNMARVGQSALPSCVLVLSRDESLLTQVESQVGGRCSVAMVATPAELARAATRAARGIVVLFDGALPAIDLPTFVGIAPILPSDTRVVLWGADERTLDRLASQYPTTRAWIPSGASTTPGTFALTLPPD